MVVQPTPVVDSSPWGQSSRAGSQVNDSPWAAASPGVVENNWKETPASDRLTFSNVGKHNEHQQVVATTAKPENVGEVSDKSQTRPEVSRLTAPTKVVGATPIHAKPQTSIHLAQPPAPKPALPIPQVNSDPSLTALKPAWSKEDEINRSKPSGVSISLREIQEVEARKAEARRAAERERERAARVSVPTAEVKGDGQPFTASWGLPTSQAGARSTIPLARDAKDASPSPSPVTPVWIASGKPPVSKKTMKEIQEEEERRKKTAVKETVGAAVARRAYAESTTKVRSFYRILSRHFLIIFQVTPTSLPQGNAWTVVGANGKSSAAAVAAPRPTSTPSTSTPGAPGSTPRVNGNTVRTVSVSPATKPTPIVSQPDDPVPPSHDFLKWLSDSLKGLNSTVNGVFGQLSYGLDYDWYFF